MARDSVTEGSPRVSSKRMDTKELTSFLEANDLKGLLDARGPCLSVYAPLSLSRSDEGQYELRWKECIKRLASQVERRGTEARPLLDSISDWWSIYQPDQAHGRGVAVFRAPDVFERIWLDHRPTERAVAGPHFYIRPLLPYFSRERVFYILALSQNDVRLLRCTAASSEQTTLAGGVPTNFDAFMNEEKPDHVRDNRSTAGPSSGSSKGVMFGTGAGLEDHDEFLAHFFRQIDRALGETLREKSEPVVLAGVDHVLALYRSLTRYPNIVEDAVQGAPNSLKGGEMHARALAAIEKRYERKVERAIEEYQRNVGGRLAIHGVKDVVMAAHDGRIRILLVSDSIERMGRVDEMAHAVKVRSDGAPEEEDLLNDASVQAILHGGQVLVAPNSKMPNGSGLAAVLRF